MISSIDEILVHIRVVEENPCVELITNSIKYKAIVIKATFDSIVLETLKLLYLITYPTIIISFIIDIKNIGA
jgi:hypothetical protein